MRENDTLLNSRFEAASRARLGSRDDTKAILKAIRDQMSPLRPLKPEIRWPSPEVVMVYTSWSQGPLAAAGYYYILEKTGGAWKISHVYMLWVS